MTTPGPRLQPLTRARVASLGAAGAAWQASLPRLLAHFARRWSLTLGRSLPGGSSSYVVAARTAEGVDAVLKLSLPDPALPAQVDTLRRAAGRGYVRVLAADLDQGAQLLERLGPSLEQSRLPVPEQLRLLADTLALAWQPAADHPTAYEEKAADLGAFVARAWQELGRPCPEAVVEQALSYAERRRQTPPGELVYVHGDPHPGNLLRSPAPRPEAGSEWSFIDPSGFVTDRAYDLGVALRDWSGHLQGPDARRRLEGWCQLLADRSGVDATRIWEWGYLERVSTGLYVLSFGAARVAEPFLRSAEHCR